MIQPAARFTLITAARLLDGSGAPPVETAALLIDGDRVAGLGRAADVHVPGGASVERRDYGAATILPGLVDAHTHLVAPGDGTLGDDIAKEDDDILLLQAAKNARTLLHSGVTTLRDCGGPWGLQWAVGHQDALIGAVLIDTGVLIDYIPHPVLLANPRSSFGANPPRSCLSGHTAARTSRNSPPEE